MSVESQHEPGGPTDLPEAVRTGRPPGPAATTPPPRRSGRAGGSLWGHVLVAAAAGLVGAAGAAAIAWTALPTQYSATAWLRVTEEVPAEGVLPDEIPPRKAAPVLARSSFVLRAALEDPKVAGLPSVRGQDDPVRWFHDNLRVIVHERWGVMAITLSGADPDGTATLVNAVADAYMKEVVEVDRDIQRKRKHLVELTCKRNQEQIEKRTFLIDRLAESMGTGVDPELVRARAVRRIGEVAELRREVQKLRQKLAGVERRMSIIEARREARSRADDGDAVEQAVQAGVEAALADDAWLRYATDQMNALEGAIFEEKRRSAREDAPTIRELQTRLASLREAAVQRRAELRPGLVEQFRAAARQQWAAGSRGEPEDLAAELPRAAAEKAQLEAELEVAFDEFKQTVEASTRLEALVPELERRLAELDRLRETSDRLARELEAWENRLAGPGPVRVMERASPPRSGDLRRKGYQVAGIAWAALVVVFLGVLSVGLALRALGRGVRKA